MEDIASTIISQYANSPVTVAVINAMNAAIDPSAEIDDWYNQVWNIYGAAQSGFNWGLDLWGRILGVSRILTVQTGEYFGYTGPGTDGASGTPYNVGVYNPGLSGTVQVALANPAYLTLLLAKAYTNISNGSIPSINNILMFLFGAGNGSGPPTQPAAYCTSGAKTMTYTFSFTPTDIQLAIINSGVLPRPSGVALTVVHP